MRNARLCPNDLDRLMTAMKEFGQLLEEIGAEGIATVGFSTNGDISGTFSLNEKTSLLISIEDDGDEFSVKYND